ncbi:MAG: hypothetical protein MJ240_00600 [Kiritimatiellae bacterium]|nr:hypothetical protein [Kiritimatiellia bacterium]
MSFRTVSVLMIAFAGVCVHGAGIPANHKVSSFARQGQKVSVAQDGAAWNVRFDGKLDWCVNFFPQQSVKPGEEYELAARLDPLPGGTNTHTFCRISAILDDAKGGNISWVWAATPLQMGQVTTKRFLVPPGVAKMRVRLIGLDDFEGRISALDVRKVGERSQMFLPVDSSWKLTSRNLDVCVFARSAAFAVTDRRSGVTRSPQRTESLDFLAHGLVCDATADAQRVRLALLDPETFAKMTVTYVLDPETDELEVFLAADPDFPMGSQPRCFPSALSSRTGERMVLPVNEGIAYPVDEPYRGHAQFHTYGGHGLCMAFAGVCTDPGAEGKGGAGYGMIFETPDDGGIKMLQTPGTDRLLTGAPFWQGQKKRFGYTRRVRYFFFAEGGHVALAKRYRQYAKEKGLFKTFREKARTRPAVDRLLGAANVWYWSPRKLPHLEIVKDMQALGIDRILWSASGSPEVIAALNQMPGVLTSRYDIYQDVYYPEMMEATGHKRVNGLNGEAWPHDIIWTSPSSNDWKQAWSVKTKDGRFVPTAMMCDMCAPEHERRRLTEERKSYRLTARFIDTTVAAPWQECWNPAHPMTRTESKYWKMELLRLLGDEFGLVVGSETGIDASVPYCDYYEGMLSIGPYRVPNAGRDVHVVWTNEVPERVAKFQVGEKYRLPLWELVYHDCVCAHWYWGDYNNKLPTLWHRRDLFNVLYGTMGMYLFNSMQWTELRERFAASFRMTSPVARATGYSEMLWHRYLTPDRTVQRTAFADGTVVTVNFGSQPFSLPEGGTLGPEAHKVARQAID